MKHLKTLITLFLLAIGTNASWAFEDFEIDLTQKTPVLPTGVEMIPYLNNYTQYHNDNTHGWHFYAIQFDVDGPVDIIVGGCQHQGGYYASVVEANNKSHEIENSVCGQNYTYEYKGGAQTLKLYCGQYCPYIKVAKHEALVATNNFTIDLTKETVELPTGVNQIDNPVKPGGARLNGPTHGWQWYAIEFYVDANVNITIDGCDYQNGYTGYLADANGNKIAGSDFNNTTCFETYTYKYEGEPQKLKLYCGQFCSSIAVTEAKPISNLNINLVTKTAPVLPVGVTQIRYPFYGYNVDYRKGDSHGTSWYAVQFDVNGPVKITLGGCEFNGEELEKWNQGAVKNVTTGETLCTTFETLAAGCSGSGSFVYPGGPATLKVYCGEFCPYVKVEETEAPAHIHSFTSAWTKTETHHYHACTETGCDITDYSAVSEDIAAYVDYEEHDYATIAKAANGAYYTCQTCGFENASRKADADAAVGVMALIDAIGEVKHTDKCKDDIQAALNAYNALTEVQQGLVTNHDVLVYAQTTYDALAPVNVPIRTATWVWKGSKTTDKIFTETNFNHSTGFIHSDISGVNLEIDAISGVFTMDKAGSYYVAYLTKDCTIKVPIRRMGDKVTVVCGEDQNNYIIGEDKKASTGETMTYVATQKDFEAGYVAITATGDSRFFRIEVEQKQFKSVLPMITLNSGGWASFTSLIKDQMVTLPASATAYVAIAADDENVTLKKVSRFTYGEGVFILGDPNAELYAYTVDSENQVSDVSKVTNNLTVGCTKDAVIFGDSGGYVIATNNKTKKAGFYQVKTQITVPAGKAYLYATNAEAKELNIVFEDGEEATGIESVLAVESEKNVPTVFYNLAGQVVGKDYKGIVIGNDGKKYVK